MAIWGLFSPFPRPDQPVSAFGGKFPPTAHPRPLTRSSRAVNCPHETLGQPRRNRPQFCPILLGHLLGIVKLSHHKERKERWLEAYPDVRKKYLNQCVVCQEIGYDPVKMERAEKPGLLKNIGEYFHPLVVNEIGVCTDCARRMQHERNDA